jgi:exoribonuclease R
MAELSSSLVLGLTTRQHKTLLTTRSELVRTSPMKNSGHSGHRINGEVAADVRLMNAVAQARRAVRFQNGAIALNATKLTFHFDGDGETPTMCQPYEIRDSNRLVEEYMLLANYLVAH